MYKKDSSKEEKISRNLKKIQGRGYRMKKNNKIESTRIDKEILTEDPIIDWKTESFGTKPQFDESKEEEIKLNMVIRNMIPEGFEKVLWGDLMVMFNPDEQDEFWNSQHEWKVVSWKLHSSSGVHTLMTEEGLVIHMLIEKKYPLQKEIVVQMLKLKLESDEESTMALELIRFIKKVLADLESKEERLMKVKGLSVG
ncbi:hypothetical protein Tco_0112231 [Tanacetum coccineum]